MLEARKDEFQNGNDLFFDFEKETGDDNEDADFEVGERVEISIYGITERFYNYMNLLLEQTENGNPFSAPPVQLRGNCVNTTNDENYPFGPAW